jgi:hypothetical protein
MSKDPKGENLENRQMSSVEQDGGSLSRYAQHGSRPREPALATLMQVA